MFIYSVDLESDCKNALDFSADSEFKAAIKSSLDSRVWLIEGNAIREIKPKTGPDSNSSGVLNTLMPEQPSIKYKRVQGYKKPYFLLISDFLS
jgi:hypothetical protein